MSKSCQLNLAFEDEKMHTFVAAQHPDTHEINPGNGVGTSHQQDPRRYSEQLGDELRQYREHTDLTAAAVAEHMSWTWDTLSGTELGLRLISQPELDKLIDLYEASPGEAGRLRDLRALASKEGPALVVPTRYRQFHALQAAAAEQRTYAPSQLPPVCRIEEYAAVLTESAPLSEQEDAADPAHYQVRQSHWLLNRDQPLEVHLVLGEAALYNLADSRRLQVKQLDHVAKLAKLPNFYLQILPFDESGHAATDTTYTLLSTHRHTGIWLCTENLHTAPCTDDRAATQAYEDAFNVLAARALGPQDSLDRLLGVRRAHATCSQRRGGIDTVACRRLHNQFKFTHAQLGVVFGCSTETISNHLRRYDPSDALAEPVPGKPAEPWRPPAKGPK